MPRLSLRAKIMLCCVGLVALLDLLVLMFVRGRLSIELRAECLEKGRNMAVNLSEYSEHPVLTEDFVRLRRYLTDLKDSDEDVAYAYVTDRRGNVLAHTFAGGFPGDLRGVNIPDSDSLWTTEPLDTVEEGLVHDVAVPILRGKVGFVHLGISEQRIRRTISHFTFVIVVIAGIVLVVAVGLAAVVSWVVTQPVRSLTKAAQKIRHGELGQQVVATTKDEVGELVESFNLMSKELLRQHEVVEERSRRISIAQEQAAWERDKLRAIIDSMAEGIIFVDSAGRISLCNKTAAHIWQTSSQDLLGRAVHECPAPELRSKLEEILQEANGKRGFAAAHSLEVRNGRCLAGYSTVHAEDGRYLGLVFLSLDVSDRVALEQEQSRLREQLFQQEKMVVVGQIAASVAHELNTPLSTILLRAELLRRQMGDGVDLSDLSVLESEAQRCRSIIDSLLGFSRRSEGKMSRTDIDSLVKKSISLMKNDLALKAISTEADYACNGATIWGDSNQIQQVLLNLFTNAADAMPEGGRLKIETRLLSKDNSLEIRIMDEGCGMEQEVLDRIFDPFFTTKEQGKGTGLGLPICRRIVEEHEGKIEIHSQPGRGTTVSIRLPLAPPEGSVGG